jgi:hypothetical protein
MLLIFSGSPGIDMGIVSICYLAIKRGDHDTDYFEVFFSHFTPKYTRGVSITDIRHLRSQYGRIRPKRKIKFGTNGTLKE